MGLLSEAEDAWTELERPLEAARCRLMAGFRLRDDHDPERANELLGAAATECERLGVDHLAENAKAVRSTRRAGGRPRLKWGPGTTASCRRRHDHHGGIPGLALALGVDRLPLGDLEAAADFSRLALGAGGIGRPTRLAAGR